MSVCLSSYVHKWRVFAFFLLSAFLVGTLSGCGGGTPAFSAPPPAKSPDFTLSLSSNSLSLPSGASATLTASDTAINGFASNISIQIMGLPTGVTYTPSAPVISPGSSLELTFTAASTASSGSATVTFTGSAASITHSVPLSLTIKAPPGNSNLFRTRYQRTDAATGYGYALNGSWMIYHAPTNRYFVSDPGGNRVVVMDAAKEAEIGSIAVPGAYSVDETPDHTLLYIATQVGDIYTIDPVAMTVERRYPAAKIGPNGFSASAARVLANSKLALLGAAGGIPSVDGSSTVMLWNPADNSLSPIYGGGTAPCTVNYLTLTNIGAFTLTGDRSLVVIGSIDSDGTLCTIDPNTGARVAAPSGTGFIYNITPTPDGKSLMLPIYSSGVAVFDAHTLTQTALFPVDGDTSSAASMIASPDSKTLYMAGAGFVYAYDIASGKQVGWLPNLTVEPTAGGGNVSSSAQPILQAFDQTGLLAGPMEEGVGFLDTTALKTGALGSQFLNDYVVPATGPEDGGTQVQWENLSASGKLQTAYFGGNAATSLSLGTGEFYATTPAGTTGPVDLYALMTDGGMLIVPEAFSYGPTVLEVTPNMADAAGGSGIIYGYGFGSTDYDSSLPTDLKLSIGGKSATVTGYEPAAYENSSPPFPLQAISYTIPAGSPGTSADATLTTSSGSATASGAIAYLPKATQFPLPGAALAQGIYDAKRDLYYFSDASQIQVFSGSQGAWKTAIPVPAAPAGTMHRLWGIALSQDGSKLAVSDPGTAMIYAIDPDTGSAKSFPVTTYFAGYPITLQGQFSLPAGLAISNSGGIYFVTYEVGGDGLDGFFKLDEMTGNVKDYSVVTFDGAMLRTAISPDNSHVYFNNEGEVISVDTASDTLSYASVDPSCCYGDDDLAIAANGATVEATSYLYDDGLNAQSYLVLSDRDAMNTAYVYGAKLSSDGSLFFQPSSNGIDVFDGRLGTLRTRIALPVALSEKFDALVSDGKDNVLVAITGETGNGIAIVDLSSLAEPAPLPYASTNSGQMVKIATSHRRASSFSAAQLSANQATQRIPATIGKHARRLPKKPKS